MIRVERDGQIVPLTQGTAPVAGRDVPLGFNEVMNSNDRLEDHQVTEELLERIKAGDVNGLAWFEDDTEVGAPAGSSVPDRQGANGPAFDPDGGPKPFDPDEVTQEAVLNYLKTADPAEVDRVKAVEAEGQNRKKIAEFEPKDEDE